MLSVIADSVISCAACPLRAGCNRPVPGEGDSSAPVALVGEAPGQTEDKEGRPFVGQAGRILDALLGSISLPRASCFISNVIKCRPPRNATPTAANIRDCRKWLDLELATVHPRIIVAMGATALSYFGLDGSVELLHGRPREVWLNRFDEPKDKIILLPAYHPAAGLHQTNLIRQCYDDFSVLGKLLQGADPASFSPVDAFPNPAYTVDSTATACYWLSLPAFANGAVDTESVGGKLWSVQVSLEPGQAIFIPATALPDKPSLVPHTAVHNYLHDVNFLTIPDEGIIDTMVAAYLLGLPQGLKELANRLCGMEMRSYDDVVTPYRREKALRYLEVAASHPWPDPEPVEVVKWDNKAGRVISKLRKPQHIGRKMRHILADAIDKPESTDPWKRWYDIESVERHCVEAELGLLPDADLSDAPFEDTVRYACADSDATLRVWLELRRRLDDLGLLPVFYGMDTATLPLVHSMMRQGFPVNVGLLEQLSADFRSRMVVIADKASAAVEGKRFNPDSDKQVALLLYGDLRFKPTASTPTGMPKVDSTELKKVNHPVVEHILAYRGLSKLDSTYTGGLVEQAILHPDGVHRLHTTIKTTRTETGRWCVHPDTPIEAPRDLIKYPDGIPLRLLSVGDWVYTITWDKYLTLRRVTWVGPTQVRPVLAITLRGEGGKQLVLRVSPEHLVRMWDGDWRPAAKLKVGNRLCCMVKRHIGQWSEFFPTSKRRVRGESGGKVKEHRLIYALINGRDRLPSRWDVHHKDGNKLNDHPSNLEFVYHPSHISMHRKRKTREEVEAMLAGAPLTVHPKTLRALKRYYNIGVSGSNHVVVSIVQEADQQLWDLEVEDTHSFIGAEVCLHNSSASPNLQNLPVRTKDGKMIRQAFVASPGRLLLEADYKQIEMKVVAHLSQCRAMIDLFRAKRDLHTETAALVNGISLEEAAQDIYRYPIKRCGFGIIYGITAKGLYNLFIEEEIAGWDEPSCGNLIRDYYKLYPEIKGWQQETVALARRNGYVRDMFGRIRYVPEIFCPIRRIQESGTKMVMNMPVQSTAADILKLAMAELWRTKPPEEVLRFLMQIHDSLLSDVDIDLVEAVSPWLKNTMEHIVSLSVPTEVSLKVGYNWAEME